MQAVIIDMWRIFANLIEITNRLVGSVGMVIIISMAVAALINSRRPAKKWSTEKIKSEKDKIERRFDTDGTANIPSVTEYLIQRLTSDSINCSQAKYENAIDKLVKKRIEAKNRPEEYEPWQSTQQSRYSMSFDEFKRIVLPCLSRYQSYTIGYTKDDARLLFDATNSDYQIQREANEKLRWVVHEDVLKITSHLKQNYESLIRAKEEGKKGVKISIRQGCSCLDFLDNTSSRIDDMLMAYVNDSDKAPLLPPPEIICFTDPERYYACNCHLSPCTEAKQPFGKLDFFDDPSEMPANWKEHLIGIRKRHIKTLIANNIDEINEINDAITNFDSVFDKNNALDMITSHLKMQDLRNLQRKIGLSGLRTKADVAQQIVSTSLSSEHVDEVLQSIKAIELESLHTIREDIVSHGEYLKTL